MRRVEARILFDADQPTGAVYLAGYVVEFMLKALIIENCPVKQQSGRLEELKQIGHNLSWLVEEYRKKGGAVLPPQVANALSLVGDDWSPVMRYDPKEFDPVVAERFLEAVDEVYRWSDGRL